MAFDLAGMVKTAARALALALALGAFTGPGAVAEGLPRSQAGTEKKMIVAYSDYSYKGVPSTDPLLLAASIREFGGTSKDVTIRLYVPSGRSLAPATAAKARDLNVEVREYRPDTSLSAYPFAQKGVAAAAAEKDAEGEASLLIWFDRDSLVLGDLSALALPGGKTLGFRPVNARNIGRGAEMPLDPFWARAYELGGLDPETAGVTSTYMEAAPLHFYIAAGIVAVRPERGVLRKWAELSTRYATDSVIPALCRKNASLLLFMHQAALSVAAASLVPEAERLEYPPNVMYPLNFWSTDDEGRRPRSIDAVLTLRYDMTLEGEDWRSLPMGDGFRTWLASHIH